ncbi:MAG: 50S ribosomal protein L11 methyltransferase [Pseudohongiellaceae bacterium]|jgi:ribosomal protein L11 methyltransferase|tara:strand:+ start:328 stop:1212 length:885 start_codon:yes stop_codon:yes gene_type:complete
MPWQQLKIQLHSDQIHALEPRLLANAAISISYLDAENQAIFQLKPGSTPLWDNSYLLCLFDETADLEALLKWLKQHPAVINKRLLQVEVLADQDWERSWMQDFKAMQFGNRLWICPSWQSPPDSDSINIMLDPGLAFGSGSHATTSMCLQWLAQAPLEGSEVIDYGCGSGVLAIAAALLGANRVYGVDNDPQAIVATLDNSHRNNIDDAVLTACLPEALPPLQVDILVANILAEPLLQLAEKFSILLKPGGKIVLSGLLPEQADTILNTYDRWFAMDTPVLEREWVRLSGTRCD